jgi:2',3'-cyclic-nucleotide 2'-phosphodiesterase (5'-nucleotidase family)
MTKLVGATTFPWLLSNVIDVNTGTSPAPLHRFVVTERAGVRVGLVGLVEQDWIATIPSWPTHFAYRPMREVALELSKELRDPNGPHRVDIIIALTHSRVPNDVRLANELGAAAGVEGVEEMHGVDLLIGGHDHVSVKSAPRADA